MRQAACWKLIKLNAGAGLEMRPSQVTIIAVLQSLRVECSPHFKKDFGQPLKFSASLTAQEAWNRLGMQDIRRRSRESTIFRADGLTMEGATGLAVAGYNSYWPAIVWPHWIGGDLRPNRDRFLGSNHLILTSWCYSKWWLCASDIPIKSLKNSVLNSPKKIRLARHCSQSVLREYPPKVKLKTVNFLVYTFTGSNPVPVTTHKPLTLIG